MLVVVRAVLMGMVVGVSRAFSVLVRMLVLVLVLVAVGMGVFVRVRMLFLAGVRVRMLVAVGVFMGMFVAVLVVALHGCLHVVSRFTAAGFHIMLRVAPVQPARRISSCTRFRRISSSIASCVLSL